MEVGVDSFATFLPETQDQTGVAQRMADLLAEIETADRVGWTALVSANTTARVFRPASTGWSDFRVGP